MLELKDIEKILPHRYPFLLVDRIIELEEGRRAVGLKNVTGNEWYFAGHFPEYPVMPGVLIVEAMAQVGATALLKSPPLQGKIAFLAGVEKSRFRRQVQPGDQLRMEMELTRVRSAMGRGEGKAFVGEELAAEAEILFAIK